MTARHYGESMRYQVLGPLRATRDGDEVSLGGPQQRLVLALLLAENGRPVSTARLIDGIWGEDEPATAKKALQGYVHHLRTQIGDTLKTEGNGYSLATNGDLDAHDFERLQQEANATRETDPGRAAKLLRDALEQWNGAPYADLGDYLALGPEIARLEDLRVTALGQRVDVDLALGRHVALVGELEALTQEYPLHEAFRAQHMTALYRAGRQVEALRSYERFRRHLAEEMGLDPSSELRDLENRILSDDEDLRASPAAGSSDPVAVRGYELRDVVATTPSGRTYRAYQRSIGRQVTVKMLGADIADDPEFIASFLSDTKKVAALEHPHLDVVFDTWREPGAAYQVSRWFERGSLADLLAEGIPTAAVAVQLLSDVADALGYAHRNGVVHGHVAPSNVMLDNSGRAYLSDFTVGRLLGRSPEQDRQELAILAKTLLTSPTGKTPVGVDSVLEVALADDGYTTPEHLARSLRQALGLDVTTAPLVGRSERRNPYKGLKAFQETDAGDFFGRELVVDRIVDQLDQHRLVAVVGPSGSGKSSAVKAGVLPRLREIDDGVVRLVSEMYPGAYPFEELEDALRRVAVSADGTAGDLVADDRALARVLKRILPVDSELVLVIDQFEELFSMVREDRLRALFLDSLLSAVSDPKSRIRVVLTMRADFFDRPLEHARFGELFETALVPVTTPDADRLREAISGPAESLGVTFERGLVDRILEDVVDQPGALPLLQYTLTELFDQRESDTITFAEYHRTGGVLGALGARAEGLYDELSSVGKEALRHAMLRMVTVDESADDLRRRILRSELTSDQIDGAALDDALRVFGSHRLLTFDLDPTTSTPTVEVAHEALLREWARFRGWIDSQRNDLVLRRRLDAAREEWLESAEQPEYLLAGRRLGQFDAWAHQTSLVLTENERSYLDISRSSSKEVERRLARRRRIVMAVLAIATAAAVGFGFFARTQQQTAERERDESDTARLAASAPVVARTDRQAGLLLALEAYNRDPSPATLGAVQQIIVDNPGFLGYFGMDTEFLDIEWLGDDRVVGVHPDGIDVFDSESGEPLVEIALLGASDLTVAPDGQTGAVIIGLQAVEFFDLETGEATGDRLQHDARVVTLAWTPDGSTMLTGSFGGDVAVWDLETGTQGTVISAHPERTTQGSLNPHLQDRALVGVVDMAISPDASLVATVGGNHARVWEVATGRKIFDVLVADLAAEGQGVSTDVDARAARAVAFDDQPGTVIVGSEVDARRYDLSSGLVLDVRRELGTVVVNPVVPSIEIDQDHYVFATGTGRVELFPLGSTEWIADDDVTLETHLPGLPLIAVSPNKDHVVYGGQRGLSLWSLRGDGLGRSVFPLPAHRALDPSASADGGIVALPAPTENVLVEDVLFLDTDTSRPIENISSGVTFASFIDESLWLYFTNDDYRRAQEWRTDPIRPVGPFLSANSFFGTIALDSAGRFAVWGTEPNRAVATVFDRSTGEIIAVLDEADRPTEGRITPFLNTALSPDDQQLIVMNALGAAIVYDTKTWEPVVELAGGGNAFMQAAYTPDGEHLVTVSGSGVITFRDTETFQSDGRPIVGSARSGGPSLGPYFTSDGRYMIVTPEGEARIWDLETRESVGGPIRSSLVGQDPILSAGRWLTTLDEDTVVLWDLDVDSWPQLACQAVGRNMTVEEWERLGPADEPYHATCDQWPSASQPSDEGEDS